MVQWPAGDVMFWAPSRLGLIIWKQMLFLKRLEKKWYFFDKLGFVFFKESAQGESLVIWVGFEIFWKAPMLSNEPFRGKSR